MSHTPAPWAIDEAGHDPFVVRDSNGQMIAWTGNGAIGYDGVGAKRRVEHIANARLIAAAPTMYAFLQKCALDGNAEAAAILGAINA